MMQSSSKPLVAIVGRPNVGKSSLFNRISGRTSAIVSRVPGTTRDRVIAETSWGDLSFTLVDTGGLEHLPGTDLSQRIREQVDVAIAEADVIVMVVDAHAGIIADDSDVADVLRRAAKPVVLAANKVDNEARESEVFDFYDLGLGEPQAVSAYHNLGIDSLMAHVIDRFEAPPPATIAESDMRLAIVGRANVGKSMLLNAITGQKRSIVHDLPGTTRDALDTIITYKKSSISLIDTAGLRRRGRIEPGIERYGALRSVRAIDRSDVAVLLMDASELATSQDTHIASYILDSYKGVVLGINKWDLAGEIGLSKEDALKTVRERFGFAAFAPVCFVSALRGTGALGLIDTAQTVFQQWSRGVPRYDLRRTILNAIAKHPPATSGRTALKIYGVAQEKSRPPSFTFHVNRSSMVHFSYQRYLENTLRAAYGFEGSPLKMRFKGRGET